MAADKKKVSMLGKRKSTGSATITSSPRAKTPNSRRSAPVKNPTKAFQTSVPKKATTPQKTAVSQTISKTPLKTPIAPKTPVSVKVAKSPQKSVSKKSIKRPRKSNVKPPLPSSVEEMKQKVLDKQQEIAQKRKSVQEKRKSVGPKTWASVASKLTSSPWKPAASAATVKLPPKTPLRDRAIKAMNKTKGAYKKPEKPLIKTGSKRKSIGQY